MQVLFASSNQGKVTEAALFLAKAGIAVVSLKDFRLAHPHLTEPPEVEETEDTYEGNAKLKAVAYCHWANVPVIVDDAGLEVDALNGQPGVISARYAGIGASSQQNIDKLLSELAAVKSASLAQRAAHFVCVLIAQFPDGKSLQSRGEVHGFITKTPRGKGGFGYDPVFETENTGKTLAELKEQGIEVQTHRTRALKQLFDLFSLK